MKLLTIEQEKSGKRPYLGTVYFSFYSVISVVCVNNHNNKKKPRNDLNFHSTEE